MGEFPLVAELLAEQQRLDTPVARFSAAHDLGATEASTRAPQLIPLTAPGPGEQYAFEVDLDACSGCKSCVAACHSLNGLDDEETWRDVGLLVSSSRRRPFTQTVTTACHHCADPACLSGCPVLAYDKDPITGIVRHLDDQCIGCSYCVLKCPYDVPKYSSRLGIVRKCDMCHGRLAHGEAPACAQACPTEAIRIVTVATADAGQSFLPTAPDPAYTRPTTRYITARSMPADVTAADAATRRPQPAHWPLVFLLTLMPLAVGCSVLIPLLELAQRLVATRDAAAVAGLAAPVAAIGWSAGAAGLAFSVLHLGQPWRAWRVFLGLRRSWLSREAVVFGTWFPLGTVVTAERLHIMMLPARWTTAVEIAAALVGAAGLFCSVMIYADTRREFWRMNSTAPRFFGTAVVLTLAVALACSGMSVVGTQRYGAEEPGSGGRPDHHLGHGDRDDRRYLAEPLAHARRYEYTKFAAAALAILLAAAMAAKLLIEARALAPLRGDRDTVTPALTTARLLTGPLRGANELRLGCAATGGLVIPFVIAFHVAPGWLAWPGFLIVLGGEVLERSLFFRAVDAPKMPGVPS